MKIPTQGAASLVADRPPGASGDDEMRRQREQARIMREVDDAAGRLDPYAMAALDMLQRHGWLLGPDLRERALVAGRKAFAGIAARMTRQEAPPCKP